MVFIFNDQKNIQKNRFFKKPLKRYIKFGDTALLTHNEGRIELVHITILKKKLKSFIKKKKSNLDVIREKIWYFGRINFHLQKKSKNSRMGKGKGIVERSCLRVKKNFILIELSGIVLVKIKKLIKFLNKLFSVKFYICTTRNINFSLWSKKNKYNIYNNKYLFQ